MTGSVSFHRAVLPGGSAPIRSTRPTGLLPAQSPRHPATPCGRIARCRSPLRRPPPGQGRSTRCSTGRVLVVGDDADLAAVVLRLLRRDLLGSVEVAYATARRRTPVTDLWGLPLGAGAVQLRRRPARSDLVPLVRDDVGGVLVGVGYLGPGRPAPSTSTSTGCCAAPAAASCGSARSGEGPGRDRDPSAVRRPRPPAADHHSGRAVQIGAPPTTVVRDGIAVRRGRWTAGRSTSTPSRCDWSAAR